MGGAAHRLTCHAGRVRVTVCELRTSPGALEQDWDGLVAHVAEQRSDVVVLPEMGFAPWFAAERPGPDAAWASSVAAARRVERAAARARRRRRRHAARRPSGRTAQRGVRRSARPGRCVRCTTRATCPTSLASGRRPGTAGATAATEVVEVGDLRLGVLVCTELWFLEHARAYGRAGAHLVVTPRVTPASSLDTWLSGGRTCAVVSGAWSLSSNSAEPEHGGLGWAIDPEGVVVATTSPDQPWVTVEVDLAAVDAAKADYPRYVPEL
jgi:N-carbamoylputrescine amidase